MSTEDEANKLCHRWIAECYCSRMWNEFSKSATVDDVVTNRIPYEWRGNPHSENFGDRKTHGYRLLMHFMCKISEAAKEEMCDKVLILLMLNSSCDCLSCIDHQIMI